MMAEAAPLELASRVTADGQDVITFRGELDITTADQAYTYVRAFIDEHRLDDPRPGDPRRAVTVDLADLTFCDAAGLGALTRIANYAQKARRQLRLTEPRPFLVRLMRITRLDRRFPELRSPALQSAAMAV
jgi:anti-sigma B factor antagonist